MNVSNKIKSLYQNAIVLDGQLGFEAAMPVEFIKKWEVVKRYTNAGFHGITLSLANDETTPEQAITYLAQMLNYLSQNSEQYILVKTAEDIVRAKKEQKLALRLMFQGTSPIGKNLAMVELFFRLGISSMILCYNIKTPMGDGCVELNDGGLSYLGRKLIAEMNRVGMILDCSHTGYRTSMEALEISTAPVVFSHANVYAIQPHIRNLKDDQIKAVAKSGGIIGMNGLGLLLGDEQARPEKMVEHIDYIAELVGSEYIALGLDLLYFRESFAEFMKNQSVTHLTAYAQQVQQAGTLQSLSPEQVIMVVDLLLQRGYSDAAITGILGGNVLRVMDQVSKVAKVKII